MIIAEWYMGNSSSLFVQCLLLHISLTMWAVNGKLGGGQDEGGGVNECAGWLKGMRNGKFIVQFRGKNSEASKYEMEYDARDSHRQVTYDAPLQTRSSFPIHCMNAVGTSFIRNVKHSWFTPQYDSSLLVPFPWARYDQKSLSGRVDFDKLYVRAFLQQVMHQVLLPCLSHILHL